MKKKILVLSFVMLLFAVATGSTLAYFNAEDTAHNVITSGGVDIDLTEWSDEDMTIPYPTEKVPVMPGTTVDKVVVVENLEDDAWIRASYVVTVFDSKGEVMDLDKDELDRIIHIATGEDWTEKDGWFYYNKSVSRGEVTTPLFCEVVFDGPNMTNEYQGCEFTIDVEADAVQSANNGATALEAAGWE
ncbi:MAG: hypothetical protein E7218_03425 [Anaerofustis stercorihominis]|nr:hypothetical protein [Anaerofustis stercorihominis]